METINNTPARNQNNMHIETATRELKDLFERLSKWEQEHDSEKECFGYAGIPYCLKRVRETGIDKIFFVGRDYHGKYEDDYCYFTYWDEVKKEFFSDEWGTWAAFPHYDYYEMPIYFGAAWEEGLIDKEAYLEYMKSRHLETLTHVTFNIPEALNYNLRVKVERGRKWKGEGYLIGIEEHSFRFAYPQFRNHSNDFGVSTTKTAKIWDPITHTINRANANFLEFIDQDEIMEQYILWAKNIIALATINDIHSNGQYNLGSFILDVDYNFEKFMTKWMEEHDVVTGNYETAYDAEAEERIKKAAEFRANKMPEIVEWVKNNTDKKGEDIIKLALHIFEKNYGK